MSDTSILKQADAHWGGQDISKLPGVTPAEAQKLTDAGINTVGEFWEKTARSSPNLEGFGEVERETMIPGRRLVELLPPTMRSELFAGLLYRAELVDLVARGPRTTWRRVPPRQLPAHFLRRGLRKFRRHLLDLLLLAGAALALLLVLRGYGAFSGVREPWGLGEPVVVTRQDLKKDQVLRPDALYMGRLARAPDYILDAADVEGLRLARDVPRHKPLRHADLLSFQAVAARDVAQGERIGEADLRLEWSAYRPCAVVRPREADGREARVAIRKDCVVGWEMLAGGGPATPTPCPPR